MEETFCAAINNVAIELLLLFCILRLNEKLCSFRSGIVQDYCDARLFLFNVFDMISFNVICCLYVLLCGFHIISSLFSFICFVYVHAISFQIFHAAWNWNSFWRSIILLHLQGANGVLQISTEFVWIDSDPFALLNIPIWKCTRIQR